MKLITDHEETRPALSAWSYPQPVAIAKHFFWSAGNEMQKSRQGLLQTLLFDIFRQQPDLIEAFCPERWSKTDEILDYEPWHLTDLTKIIERVVQCNNLSIKFCFFIDGLDEFEGDHVEFCQALRKLSTSPHIKLCVSSRPWNVFEDSFGRDISSKLYIHELTRDDIHKYVKDSLEEHYRWDGLDVDPRNANSLINQVVKRAAGVFLWVFLVVKELRSGLTEYDSFSDLQRRLGAIPSDLGAFFRQILGSVDTFYHEIMAKTLKVSITVKEPESTDLYGFLDMEHADEDYAMTLPIQVACQNEKIPNSKQICRRLNAICRGLLAVNPRSDCVEFLHRSVMDYLKTDEMVHFLEGKITNTFNAILSLLRAYTARIKSMDFSDSNEGSHSPSRFMEFIRKAIAYAQELDNSQAYKLLENLEWSIQQIRSDLSGHIGLDNADKDELLIRNLTMEMSFLGYFDYILPRVPDYISRLRGKALSNTLAQLSTSWNHQQKGYDRHKDMLRYLLEHGQSPNEPYWNDSDMSPWEQMLWKMKDGSSEEYLCGGLFSLMLENGADPNIRVGDDGVVAWIDFANYMCWNRLPHPKFRELVIEVLDDYESACAIKSRAIKGTGNSQDSDDLIPGIDLACFLGYFPSTTDPLDKRLFAQVTVRLLRMADMYQHDIDQYIPIIEQNFPHLFRPSN
ncbi:hypothetical protein ABKA04_007134 [Annulohypoxylon sp. FPYF3050]